jgi:hypothetical protein
VRKLTEVKSQNNEAANMISTISSQLKSKNTKYKTIRKKVVKLQTLHAGMDTRLQTLQQQCRSMSSNDNGAMSLIQQLLHTLQQDLQAVTELMPNGSSQNSAGSLFSNDDTLNTRDMTLPGMMIDASKGQDMRLDTKSRTIVHTEEDKDIMLKASLKIDTLFESELATYVIRPPTYDPSSEWGRWSKSSVEISPWGVYANHVQANDPSSWEIMAQIKCDVSSMLYLQGDCTVMVRNSNVGGWIYHGVMDRRDSPLGWVVSNKGNDYSLDEVLEEAMLFRQQYCRQLFKAIKLSELSNWERVLVDIKATCIDSKVARTFWLLTVPFVLSFQILKMVWSSLFW